ncbi:hypothetical protein BMF94_0725, partial [Rhodotorula taiwanensis]
MTAISRPFSLDEEVRLSHSNADRERIAELANLYSLILTLDYLERAYVRDSVQAKEYHPKCLKLLQQYKTIVNLLGGTGNVQLDQFMLEYRMDCTAAAHRLRVGVPATVEHPGGDHRDDSTTMTMTGSHPATTTPQGGGGGGPGSADETAKSVAETTQNFITFMDALKLKLRAKDQLHPLLTDLMQSYSRFCQHRTAPSEDGEWEGRPKMLAWLIRLNQMRASEEISEEQSRQA